MNDPTQISCPHCGQTFRLTPEQVPQYAGQTITCTKCQRAFTVPALGAAAPAAPAAPGGFAPPPSQHVPYGRPPGEYQQQRSNGWAITSLVTGILGLFVPLIPGLIAVVTGIIGLNKTKDPRVGGRGLAIAGLSIGAASIVLSGLCVSILLPSLNRAREQANRIKCASNMRQIGQAIQIYANANQGQFPPDLDTLLKGGTLTSDVFVCPTSTDAPAPVGAALTSGPYCSYVYIPGLKYTATSNTVLLYEPITNHGSDGMNVLFADTHVEWVPATQAQAMIAEVQAGQNPPPSGPK